MAQDGSDGCGIVEHLGEGVDPQWIGSRVLLNAATFQEATPYPDLVPAPEDISMIGEHGPGTIACGPSRSVA